jgi:hypothetical protein
VELVGAAVYRSGDGVKLVPSIRRLINHRLAEIGKARMDYSEAIKAIDLWLIEYGLYIREFPDVISSDLFRFNVDLFSEGLPVKNSLLVCDGYMGKLEVAYLS